MTGMLIGYVRVSTNDQDLTAQKLALTGLGVSLQKTFTDQGLTGTNRARPGLREALAACRAGDTLVVAKLDRLARSLRDAKDIVDDLTLREVKHEERTHRRAAQPLTGARRDRYRYGGLELG